MHKGIHGRRMNGELLKEVVYLKYLRSKITVVWDESEMKSKIKDVGKVLGWMKKVFSCRAIGMNVKRRVYERVTVFAALYGAETWIMIVAEKKILNVMYVSGVSSKSWSTPHPEW